MAYEAEDFARAIEILLPLAEAGIADAQFLLGLMHANGQGVEQNFYRAGQIVPACRGPGSCRCAGQSWFIVRELLRQRPVQFRRGSKLVSPRRRSGRRRCAI